MTKAQELYQLLNEKEIIGKTGQIYFDLAGLSVKIEDINVVGNILQEWLGKFMIANSFPFLEKPNTQDFPDFYLGTGGNEKHNLLEVKAFTKSPNFDVANFRAYARSLRENAYRLDSDYLIIKYSPYEGGLKIDNIWLKKVWQICSGSQRSPIKIQWKQGDPVNIRPASWYSNRAKYQPFSTRGEFVSALSQVIGMASVDSSIQKDWLKVVKENYYETTGRNI